MFHAITDGNGGLLYLKSIVRNYLALRHPGEMENVPSPNSASAGDMHRTASAIFMRHQAEETR